MEIIGFEKLSLVDFDTHTACTLFTAGCNFRCPFCHNGDLVINPTEFQRVTDDDIFGYLNKRKGLIDAVVITGGEPTLQKDLPKFAKRIKDLGFAVKLDTNGTNPEMLKRLVKEKLIDYVAMDVKSSKEGYQKAIGLKGFPSKVAESVEYLKTNAIDYEFRITLVDELITLSDIQQMADWLKNSKIIVLQRFVERDGCIKKGLNEVAKEKAEEYAKVFEKANIKVKLRNYD